MKCRVLPVGYAAALIALSTGFAAPLTNHWRAFTKSDGLMENSCVSITFGASGNILVRHAKSPRITVFDGYDFASVTAPGTNRGRIYESPGGQLWTVTREGLLEFRDGEWSPHPVPQIAAHFRTGRTNEVRLRPVRQGRVLIFLPDESLQLDATDPEHEQLTSLLHSGNVAIPADTSGEDGQLPELFSVRRVFDRQTDPGGAVWFATTDGLFRQTRELWEATEATGIASTIIPGFRSGRETLDMAKIIGVSNAIPGGRISVTSPDEPPEDTVASGAWKSFLIAKNGDAWLGGANGIARRHQNSWRIFSSTNQIGPEDVLGFAEAPDGRIWCATPYKVWEFDGRNWLALRGGFDRINALHCSRDGLLWVATTRGVHRFIQGAWVANGTEDGLAAGDIRRIHEDASGRITVETARGVSAFHSESDTDAPRTYIGAPAAADTQFREGAVVTISFHGRDKWKQTSPARLLFSYRLDEREWSPFLEMKEISFADLPLGKHYFQARAMDRAGNVDPKPARLEFTVVVPWYRETRLVLILTIALVVAISFAALAFNRHRKLQRSYAEVERQVTERTRELELASRELLHSQKMNALGSLSASIAHDFNNILSIIKGSAQIIEDNTGNPDKIRTRVDRIKTVVQQGAEVVDAMLGFSRSTDQPPAPCDLNAVVDETRKLLGDRFLREVEVRFERGDGLPEISVPRDFVQQILLNFVFNAAEAMAANPSPDLSATLSPSDGERDGVRGSPTTTRRKQIMLATSSSQKLPPELFLTPTSAANYILVSVQDCGSGIAPEIKPRIFEPFFTTKSLSTKRGTGLGLSMVYELAKKMEAGLAVESNVGQGSTFTLILPVKAEAGKTPTTDEHG